MRVELFFTPDCPHRGPAMTQLRAVLRLEGVAEEIHEVVVTSAKRAEKLRFRGSPTIRINGRDIDPEPQVSESFALACRIYPGAGEPGVPSAEMMRRAIREALSEEKI